MNELDKLIKDINNYIPYNEQEEKDKDLILKYIDLSNILNRCNTLCHLTSSCFIVNKDYSKILMVYHNIYNSWSWPGGHADGDADLLRVALKEAKEETGVVHIKEVSKDIFSLESLTVDGHIKRGEYVSSHLHLNVTYLLMADENDEVHAKLDENKKVAWIDIDNVLNEVSEVWMNKYIYSKLINKVKLLKERISL